MSTLTMEKLQEVIDKVKSLKVDPIKIYLTDNIQQLGTTFEFTKPIDMYGFKIKCVLMHKQDFKENMQDIDFVSISVYVRGIRIFSMEQLDKL